MKALIVGLGGIGQRHVRNLRTLLGERLELIAYRVRRQSSVLTDKLQIEQGSVLEQKYGIHVFDDLDAALAEKPDVAFICNPTSLHVPVALACARAGCHLFVEKPISHDLEGVAELIDVVERKRLIGFVAYQMRFHPCLKWVKAKLEQHAIGRVLAVRAEVGEYLPAWHTYEDYRQMYASRSDLGGGVIVTQIHEIDYLLWFFGLPRSVFALGGHLSSLEIDVEDVASILMDIDGLPVHLHQDYVQRPPSRTLQVVGDSGKIMVDLRAPSVLLFTGDDTPVETHVFADFERNQLFMDELKHFLACIEGKEVPMVPIQAGAQSLRIALAAKESLTTGAVVRLE
jgi:predicted dehydrogenase